jgi:hypothetical protein
VSVPPPAARADGLEETFAALQIPPEHHQPVRDILRLSRERFVELTGGRQNLDKADFAAIVKTVAAETRDNLGAVIGADKLAEWRAYNRRDRPVAAR